MDSFRLTAVFSYPMILFDHIVMLIQLAGSGKLTGGIPKFPFKRLYKAAGIRETHTLTDFLNTQFRIRMEHFQSLVNPETLNILNGGHPHIGVKQPAQVLRRNIYRIGQSGDRQIGGILFPDDFQNRINIGAVFFGIDGAAQVRIFMDHEQQVISTGTQFILIHTFRIRKTLCHLVYKGGKGKMGIVFCQQIVRSSEYLRNPVGHVAAEGYITCDPGIVC